MTLRRLALELLLLLALALLFAGLVAWPADAEPEPYRVRLLFVARNWWHGQPMDRPPELAE